MAESNCGNCKLREKYDKKPKSLLGRFWRWHIGFCPGWKGYMKSLDEDKRNELKVQYNLK
uniref:hypothetical protein n=1 Tax=uncultured Draconibacterium sp. TaxID=1573823 RepID=UPI003216D6ED